MTAEIAILNREGVALAADSAVTVRERSGEKVFSAANKIFTLSKYHPVAVMVYGSADFMGVPWETVIKVFREGLGQTRLTALQNYAERFFDFLKNDRRFSPKEKQELYVRQILHLYFGLVQQEIESAVTTVIAEHGEVTRSKYDEIMKSKLKKHREIWQGMETAEGLPSGSAAARTHEEIIKQVKDEHFKTLSSLNSRWLTELGLLVLERQPPNDIFPGTAGIVFAGFGDRDIFPCFYSYAIGGVIRNHVQYRLLAHEKVSQDKRAIVKPFAQDEMVYTFMEGIHPAYRDAIETSLVTLIENIPDLILDRLTGTESAEKAKHNKEVKVVLRQMLEKYREELQRYRGEQHVQPIIRAVAALPKNELAAVAESLVNLTAFKRRVSMDSETVGEPIDVAVVSKGDGFVWIKRKHYFPAELNSHFFANYFRQGGADEEQRE